MLKYSFAPKIANLLYPPDYIIIGYYFCLESTALYVEIKHIKTGIYMAVFAISDLHLPGGANINKSMERFGSRWLDHKNKIERCWRAVVSDCDTVIIPGDISWAMTEDEAAEDLIFIDSLPGRKIIGRGNHDFWWSTLKKLNALGQRRGIKSIEYLQNNAFAAENFVICGSRGWFFDAASQADIYDTDYKKLADREAARLELSIKAGLVITGGDIAPLRIFLHFPGALFGDECTEIFNIIKKYGLEHVYFGHIHGNYDIPRSYIYHDVEFICVSADYLNFTPALVR